MCRRSSVLFLRARSSSASRCGAVLHELCVYINALSGELTSDPIASRCIGDLTAIAPDDAQSGSNWREGEVLVRLRVQAEISVICKLGDGHGNRAAEYD
jgi:hypothetical protein